MVILIAHLCRIESVERLGNLKRYFLENKESFTRNKGSLFREKDSLSCIFMHNLMSDGTVRDVLAKLALEKYNKT